VEETKDHRGAGTVHLPSHLQTKLKSGQLQELDIFQLFCPDSVLQKLVDDANERNSQADFEEKRKKQQAERKIKQKRTEEHPSKNVSFDDCKKMWEAKGSKRARKKKKKNITQILDERSVCEDTVELLVKYKDLEEPVWEKVDGVLCY